MRHNVRTMPYFGRLGQVARVSRGKSRRDVADALGVTPAAVGTWERGDNLPRMDRLLDWYRELGIELTGSFSLD